MALEANPRGESSITTCPLDCPDACKLVVTVKDERVVKIDGAQDEAHTNGYICGKVRQLRQPRLFEPSIADPFVSPRTKRQRSVFADLMGRGTVANRRKDSAGL